MKGFHHPHLLHWQWYSDILPRVFDHHSECPDGLLANKCHDLTVALNLLAKAVCVKLLYLHKQIVMRQVEIEI
jgi:hypothetical protein